MSSLVSHLSPSDRVHIDFGALSSHAYAHQILRPTHQQNSVSFAARGGPERPSTFGAGPAGTRPPAGSYRAGVGIALFNRRGEVFIARRSDVKFFEAWQMPQGGIDEGETPQQAVLRELKEETGTDKVTIIGETRQWLFYDVPKRFVKGRWDGQWRGQQQKWFAAVFEGVDSDILLNATVNPEFDSWRWAEPSEICDLVVSFKKDLYRVVLREFAPLISRLRVRSELKT